MFVNIIQFPKVKNGKDAEFRKWFADSNRVYAKFDGFISRRLLVSEEGRYAAIVEHKSKDTFMKMHKSKERDEIFAKIQPLIVGNPTPSFYAVLEV